METSLYGNKLVQESEYKLIVQLMMQPQKRHKKDIE